MSLPSLRRALAAGVAAAFCLTTASLAQGAHPAAPGSVAHAPLRMQPADREQRMTQHLRDILQLRPDQDAALSAFVAALRPPPGMHEHMGMDGDDDEHLTAPQRVDRMLAQVDRMRDHFATVADATKRFYAQLSPAQQRAFDDLAPMMLHHMGGDHRAVMIMHRDDRDPGDRMGPGGPPPG